MRRSLLRMGRRLFFLTLIAIQVGAGGVCQQTASRAASPSATVRERLLEDLRWLCAPEQRGRGQEDLMRVPLWIEARFRAAGLLPLYGHSYLDGFSLMGVKGVNVGGVLPGRGWPKDRRHVIVSAHHDHLGLDGHGGFYPGAADNAAGVAAMLRILSDLAPRAGQLEKSVVFLAFDLEERGLFGSRHYVKHPALPLESLTVFTTMDILGRELLNLDGARLAVMGVERSGELGALAGRACPEGLELFFLGSDVIGSRSDYAAFRKRGIPFLFFSTGENRDYHKISDTPDRIDLASLDLQSAFVRDVILALTALDRRPRFSAEPLTTRIEVDSLRAALKALSRGKDADLKAIADEILPDFETFARLRLKAPRDRTPLLRLARHVLLAHRRILRRAR